MPRGPRALIFDFDGVIVDDEPLHLAAFQEALAAEGITLTREAYYARYLGFDDHDAVVEALREAGRPAPPERVRALMAAKADRFLRLVRAGAPIFPGVPAFVRAAAARVALLALYLLQDQARRLGHHLLHDLAHRLLGGLELGDQRREDGEVALLGVGAHAPEPRVHRLHEAAVGGDDLAIEVLLQHALVHARSIESRFLRFNAIAALSALLVAGAAGAVEVPGTGGRVVAGGYLDGLAVAETEGGPRQRPGALLDLHLDGRATPWLRVHLDLRSHIGGRLDGRHPVCP